MKVLPEVDENRISGINNSQSIPRRSLKEWLFTLILVCLVAALLAFYSITIDIFSHYPESSDFGKFYISSSKGA